MKEFRLTKHFPETNRGRFVGNTNFIQFVKFAVATHRKKISEQKSQYELILSLKGGRDLARRQFFISLEIRSFLE